MTGGAPFWNRKSREGGVFWFLVLLLNLKKKKIKVNLLKTQKHQQGMGAES